MRLTLVVFSASVLFAQAPQFVNARLDTRTVTGALEPELRALANAASGPEWVAYTVPMLPGKHEMCRSHWRQVVKLEGPDTLIVLIRLANHAIDKIEAYSTECEIDAGSLPVHLLDGVAPPASVSYLASIAPEHKQAVFLIAMHADASADAALERLAAPSQPVKVKEDVVFWLGSARGARGVELLKKILAQDPSDRVREKIMFALSVSKEPAALTQLLESARNDPSSRVRSQALFWLAHKAGEKEAAAITRAIAEDPDTKVKKEAVFALQQLPPDEGIPLLIRVAKTNPNPEVRKQAMFWLGQSKDERALKFFEEILTK